MDRHEHITYPVAEHATPGARAAFTIQGTTGLDATARALREGKPVGRRAVLRLGLGVGAAALVGSAVIVRAASAQDADAQRHTEQPYTVSTAANFRSGPGTSYSVIRVIQPGETFTLNAQEQNGFYAVNFQGTNGWVYAQFIVPAGGTDPGPNPGQPAGYATTTATVNLRSGPGTSYQVLQVVPAGASVMLYTGLQNNFRAVAHAGQDGWIYADYLTSGGGQPTDPIIIGNAVTTTSLNLRSGPSSSHTVLRVMPQGATVQISATVQNGYRYVIHQGLAGWAYAAYLSQDPGGGQPPSYKTTTVALNLREQPSTSARVLLVMPAGATVRISDQLSNGFRQVTYNGTTGWAYEAYLA